MTRDSIIEVAKSLLGQPYVWGGESAEEGGYDCSGYVDEVLNQAGYKVGRNTAQGYRSLGKVIPFSQAKPADLLFFGNKGKATHVSMYAGNAHMYESIGDAHNDKAHPGQGVTLSNVTRRRDLIEVRTLFDDQTQPEQNDLEKHTHHIGEVVTVSSYYNASTDGEELAIIKTLSDVTIGRMIDGVHNPYRLDKDGVAIGWCNDGDIRYVEETPAEKQHEIYIVQTGDTLCKIARLNNTTVRHLVSLNDIENPNAVSVGKELRLD